MRFRLKKRGSLSLSINAIVVLIMAITMLGIGLAFMRNSMGKTMKQFENVNEDIKSEMIKELQSSSSRLAFKGEDVKFKAGEKREMYFGLKNDGSASATYTIDIGCTESMSQPEGIAEGACSEDSKGDCTKISASTFDEITVEPNKVVVGKIVINIGATTNADTYSCKLSVNDGDYASKKFFLTIE